MYKHYLLFMASIFMLLVFGSCQKESPKVLVFSKTAGFRHSSIEDGKIALIKLGKENGFQVDTTEDASEFVESNLKQYAAVIFLNTTGDVLDYKQEADFQRFIQAGGGYVGIHAATDTEFGWPWYNKLAGAYFLNHPNIQEADLHIKTHDHPATEKLDSIWKFTDEWYNFKSIYSKINVLIEIDEDSYEGGQNTDHHPMSWYHEYDGGRAFYTGLGHRKETYKDSIFLQHILGGIKYAIGKASLNYNLATTKQPPSESRFVKEVLDFNLDEPMELDEIPGKGILFIERRGAVKMYDYVEKSTKTIGNVDVFYANEDGLLGLAVDPNYKENQWIYLFYSPRASEAIQHVSRFTIVEDTIDFATEKILLTIPTIRKCCHSGGGLEFDRDGNLYIGVGDNTNPFESSGFAPIDERPNRQLWDAQKSAANTNDLRGKILRITPQKNGTYTIPEGNLFPPGTPKTKPEIYAMGLRNPFRFSIDSKTNYLYWGDVGPDAGKPDSLRGPHGMGEFNQARKAGNWGWPYTRGDNQVYRDYDFATTQSLQAFDPDNLQNNSPNNTGLEKLPSAIPSMIWYSYIASKDFPWLGKGGVNPMAGPIYHAADNAGNSHQFPDYFENKLFLYEWMRDWIYVITLDENQEYVKADPFMPNTEFSHPMDMLFAKDGYLYILEYGQKWNVRNMDARLSRIKYISGNRPPIARIETNKNVGAAPLTIEFSASESVDYDGDNLKYEWRIVGTKVKSTQQNPTFTFDEIGKHTVELTVIDAAGNSNTSNENILVGNDPPTLSIRLSPEDHVYWKGKKINYTVHMKDTEDGNTTDNSIDINRVKITFNYLSEGEDMILATLGHQENTTPAGLELINNSDCKACHAKDEKVNGPSYLDIAKKYDKKDSDILISSIVKGSSGKWGETLMSAHPQHSIEEVRQMVNYILLLDNKEQKPSTFLPISGTLSFDQHPHTNQDGKYVLMASYRDNGIDNVPNSELTAIGKEIFYPPKIQAEKADSMSEGLGIWKLDNNTLVGSIVHDAMLRFDDLSLANLKSITLAASYSKGYAYEGRIDVREGSLQGPLLASKNTAYFHEDKNQVVRYNLPIHSSREKADLFFIFKNEKNKTQYILNADWINLNY